MKQFEEMVADALRQTADECEQDASAFDDRARVMRERAASVRERADQMFSPRFPGRKLLDPSWILYFEESFDTLAGPAFLDRANDKPTANQTPGGFWDVYDFDAYKGGLTTNKRDTWRTDTVTVEQVDNTTAMVLRVGPGFGTALMPLVNGAHLKGKNIKLEARVKNVQAAREAFMAWLLWFDGVTWPDNGEVDGIENELGVGSTFGSNLHFGRGNRYNETQHYDSGVTTLVWHTVGFEYEAGKQFSMFVDGHLVDTYTDASRMPIDSGRLVLQNEPNADASKAPTSEAKLAVDWITVWTK